MIKESYSETKEEEGSDQWSPLPVEGEEDVPESDEVAEEEVTDTDRLQEQDIGEQQRNITIRALKHLFRGTLLLLVFTSPLVDCLDEVGTRSVR
jgi:hypothetical protein